MSEVLSIAYPWIKAFHIVAVISWMAGLFYLPRLFVYHVERAPAGSETSETFKVMEHKLLRLIMAPAMIATWILGILLALTPGIVDWSAGWFYVKLLGVAGLTVFHHWLGKRRRDFETGSNSRSGRTYRLMNEVPTLAVLVIVIMVVVRPF